MNAWLISVVGVVSLSLLLEVLISSGSTSKYVKGAFSLVVIFVLIAPLPAIFDGDNLNLGDLTIEYDENFEYETALRYASVAESEIKSALEKEGYKVNVYIDDKIEVHLFLSVINDEIMNTHILRVQEIVSKTAGVSADSVSVKVFEDVERESEKSV
ncbi:MAG: hypothetical protein MJ193_00710 [Clostridia bacterium]|nr:hypothetical protein [Clostridia bacterium]